MNLSPLDIRKQEFSKRLRGYDPDEVEAFLSMMANQWETVLEEKRRAEERNRDLKNKIEHYQNVEEALQEALHTARENKEQVLENARREAQVIVREAKAEASSIKEDAADEQKRLNREVTQLSDRRGEIVARLRAFLMSEMELLARFDGEDPSGFLKLVPDEEQKQLGQARTDSKSTTTADRKEKSQPEARRPDPPADVKSTNDADEASRAPAEKPQHRTEPARETDDAPDRAGYRNKQQSGTASPGAATQAARRSETPEGTNPAPRASEKHALSSLADARGSQSQEAAANEGESPGWIVHSLFNAEDEAEKQKEIGRTQTPMSMHQEDLSLEDEEDVTASTEEIEKIRRILSDMDE